LCRFPERALGGQAALFAGLVPDNQHRRQQPGALNRTKNDQQDAKIEIGREVGRVLEHSCALNIDGQR
jgi:hypothetical protein